MSEWLKEQPWKGCVRLVCTAGSNPAFSVFLFVCKMQSISPCSSMGCRFFTVFDWVSAFRLSSRRLFVSSFFVGFVVASGCVFQGQHCLASVLVVQVIINVQHLGGCLCHLSVPRRRYLCSVLPNRPSFDINRSLLLATKLI